MCNTNDYIDCIALNPFCPPQITAEVDIIFTQKASLLQNRIRCITYPSLEIIFYCYFFNVRGFLFFVVCFFVVLGGFSVALVALVA